VQVFTLDESCLHGAPASTRRPDVALPVMRMLQGVRWGNTTAELGAIEAFCRDKPVVARDPDAAKILWSHAVRAALAWATSSSRFHCHV
jgi:hypothetical protein